MATGILTTTLPRPTIIFSDLSNNLYLTQVIRQPSIYVAANDWNASLITSSPTIVATIVTGEVATLSEVFKHPATNFSVVNGNILTLNASINATRLSFNVVTESVFALKATLSKPQIVARLFSDNTYILNVALQRPLVQAFWINDVINITGSTTYVLNMLNAAHSTYTNFDFNSYFKLNNKYYGINTSGIFELTGDLDNVTEITSQIDLPISSYEKQGTKACSDAFVLGRLDGDMEVITTLDEQVVRNGFFVINDTRSGLHRLRVKIPKGLKGSTWQFSLKNVDGSNFSINNFEVLLRELQRAI